MSTTITSAGNLIADPELQHTRAGTPFLTCRRLINDRIHDEGGHRVDREPTSHDETAVETSASNLYDSTGRGDRILVHVPLRPNAWQDPDSGRTRTREVVKVSSRFGEVSASVRSVTADIERHHPGPTHDSPDTSSCYASPSRSSGARAPDRVAAGAELVRG